MRTDVPGTEHWVEFRSPDEMTIGDIDAYNEPIVRALDAADNAGTPRDDVKLTISLANERRNALMACLITAWSFEDVPLPYAAESRKKIPIAARTVIDDLPDEHIKVIDGLEGPKEKTEATDGSATTSPGTSASDPPDSATEPSGTAGG